MVDAELLATGLGGTTLVEGAGFTGIVGAAGAVAAGFVVEIEGAAGAVGGVGVAACGAMGAGAAGLAGISAVLDSSAFGVSGMSLIATKNKYVLAAVKRAY